MTEPFRSDRDERTNAHPNRPKQEFQKATTHGAVVSILLMATVVALTWREFSYSMRMETVESLFVNSTISPIVDVR